MEILTKENLQPPEGPLAKDPSTQESHHHRRRVFTAETTIKIKHFRRRELIRMEPPPHMFLATMADGKTAAKQGEKGRETANTHPESAFGWVLIGWALGRSLIQIIAFRPFCCQGSTPCPENTTELTLQQTSLL